MEDTEVQRGQMTFQGCPVNGRVWTGVGAWPGSLWLRDGKQWGDEQSRWSGASKDSDLESLLKSGVSGLALLAQLSFLSLSKSLYLTDVNRTLECMLSLHTKSGI